MLTSSELPRPRTRSHALTKVDRQILTAFRYDAHPMSMMIASMASLGAFAPEANPSLNGQTLYTKGDAESLKVMDKQ